MSFSLLPNLIAEKLRDITLELLRSWGIRILMLDFDNAIVPDTTDGPTAQMIRWLEHPFFLARRSKI